MADKLQISTFNTSDNLLTCVLYVPVLEIKKQKQEEN